MKNRFLLTLMSLILGHSVTQAAGLHPCTPVVQARPFGLVCAHKGLTYNIRIDSIVSDVRRCPAKNMMSISTAQITVQDRTERIVQMATLPNEEFTYSLGAADNSTFQSPRRALDLKNCSTRMQWELTW